MTDPVELTPNYKNLAVLHNWLLENRDWLKSRYRMGVWLCKVGEDHRIREIRPVPTDKPDLGSVFGWGSWSGVDALKPEEGDYHPERLAGVPILRWPVYIARVYGLTLAMNERNWIECSQWERRDNTLDGGIARIRYVIDNALDLPGLGALCDLLTGSAELPYDCLENRPYDLNKPI